MCFSDIYRVETLINKTKTNTKTWTTIAAYPSRLRPGAISTFSATGTSWSPQPAASSSSGTAASHSSSAFLAAESPLPQRRSSGWAAECWVFEDADDDNCSGWEKIKNYWNSRFAMAQNYKNKEFFLTDTLRVEFWDSHLFKLRRYIWLQCWWYSGILKV